MRLPAILFATAVCATLVTPVFPQLPGSTSCQVSAEGAVTIKFTPAPITRIAHVSGAPHSAVGSQQSVQTLEDGTHLSTKGRVETAMWRDSDGRVRTETRVPQGENARACDSSLVKLDDPVAEYVYLLRSEEHTSELQSPC